MIEFSVPVAMFMTLFAAALWGSWMQVIKYKKNYPIVGIVFWLYAFSFLLVWGVTFALSKTLLPNGIMSAIEGNGSTLFTIFAGGVMMSTGMYISLVVMDNIGMLLSTTISGATGSVLGIATTIFNEGLPDKPNSLLLIVIIAIIFFLASFVCTLASNNCAADRIRNAGGTVAKPKSVLTRKILVLVLINSILMNGWPMGTSAGTAAGIPPILVCAILVSGCFFGIAALSAFVFTKNKLWKVAFCIGDRKMPLILSAISALCHWGGNMISIYAMPVLSATMSFLFGRTAGVWTYFWGFYHKEFAGSSKKTLLILSGGIGLYFLGLAVLFIYNFS